MEQFFMELIVFGIVAAVRRKEVLSLRRQPAAATGPVRLRTTDRSYNC